MSIPCRQRKKHKGPCSFASSKKPWKSKAYEFIRYIVWAGRKLKTTAKTNLQTQTHKSHGQTTVTSNRLQENLVKSVSCRFYHADVTCWRMFPQASGSVHLGSCPVKTSITPRGISLKISLLALLRERRNSDLAKDIFRYFLPGATFEPAL